MRISPARLATKFTPNCVLDLRNVSQAAAKPGVEVFNERAAAWRALHGLRDRSPDPVELAPHGGMQPIPALPEGTRCVGLAMQQTRGADQIVRHCRPARDGGQLGVQYASEGKQVVALVLQGDAHRADA